MKRWTAYRLDGGGKTFFPAIGPQGDIANGMVLPSGPDDYDVVQVDLDGAANKLLDFAFNLQRIAFGEAQTSIDSAQNYGFPSLRPPRVSPSPPRPTCCFGFKSPLATDQKTMRSSHSPHT